MVIPITEKKLFFSGFLSTNRKVQLVNIFHLISEILEDSTGLGKVLKEQITVIVIIKASKTPKAVINQECSWLDRYHI